MLDKKNQDITDNILSQARQLYTSGRLTEAEQAFKNILQLEQKNYDAWHGLFLISKKNSNKDEAIESLVRANAIKPSAELDTQVDKHIKKWSPVKKCNLYQQLALLQLDTNNVTAAIKSIQKALNHRPNNKETLYYFSRLLMDIRFTSSIDKKLRQHFIQALKSDFTDKQYMAHAINSALKHEPTFASALNTIINNGFCIEQINSSLITALNDELFISLLSSTLVIDQKLETILTILRKKLLSYVINEKTNSLALTNKLTNFVCVLAIQCFNNEYVFYTTPQENKQLATLLQRIKQSDYHDVSPIWYAIAASYSPITQFNDLNKIELEGKNPHWNQLIILQVKEPNTEISYKPEIAALTQISENISKAVKQQYEENPFPRWLYLPRVDQAKSIEDYVTQHLPYLALKNSHPPEILIAGCGTGLIPCTYATVFPDSNILAIDLSRASLVYGKRKAIELSMNNITFSQGDILALESLDRKFNFINCYGVLHHTNSIFDSWSALKKLLHTDGYMEIGLYSKLARQGVYAVRDYIAKQSYSHDTAGMRQCRQDLLKSDKPLLKKIVNTWAFYSMSNFRDLAFHTHEICIDLIELKELLSQLSLEFLGFSHQYPETILQYQTLYPNDKQMLSLENWNEFEHKYPTTFENCYKFWCRPLIDKK